MTKRYLDKMFFSCFRKASQHSEELSPKIDNGLHRLYPPLGEEAPGWVPSVDIVAIHGLNGHAMKTWSSGERLWLRDVLPGQLSTCTPRISTFSYDSTLFCRTTSEIRHFAEQLLAALHQMRYRPNTRGVPVVFICHSLGGIVCKKTLVVSHAQQHHYADIRDSTKGIVFMGTPHLGSDLALWGAFFGRIANVVLAGAIRTDLLRDLGPKSREFADIDSQFEGRAEGLKILSIYERVPMNGVLVVDESSARLKLSNARSIPVELNHSAMCKFPNQGATYDMISGAIVELVEAVSNKGELQECIKQLYFPEYQARRMGVANEYDGTFEWIWSHPQYKLWEASPVSTLFWLHGKPASGKSTLLNYLRSRFLARPQPQWVSTYKCVVVDFFYSDRGGNVQRTHVAMLRSLLYQILSAVPSLWVSYCARYYASEDFLHLGASHDWSLDELKTLCTQLFEECGIPLLLYVIIDAMDESEEIRRQDILALLTGFCDSERRRLVLKILVASRSVPRIAVALKNHLSLKLEDETTEDIWQYIRAEMRRISNNMDVHLDILQTISGNIFERSRGVFLWVKLVIIELEESAANGCTVAELVSLLESLPEELDTLYSSMQVRLESSPQFNQPRSREMFQWVTFSKQPLTLPELDEAIAIGACSDPISLDELKKHRAISLEHAKRRLASQSGGFLEINNNVVQFIHQTVREYLFKLPISSPWYLSTQRAEDLITSCCTRYFEFAIVILKSELRPLHAEWTAEDLDCFLGFLDELPLFNFVRIGDISGNHQFESGFGKELASAIQAIMMLQDSQRVIRLFGAVSRISLVALGGQDVCDKLVNLVDGHGRSLLHYVADTGRLAEGSFENIIRSSRRASWDMKDHEGRTPLHLASKQGSQSMIGLLIDCGADLSAIDTEGWSALHFAAESDQKDAAAMLIKRGADISRRNKLWQTPLHVASRNGSRATAQLLLDHGADIKAVDNNGETPLHHAVQNNQCEVAVMLIERGADVSATNSRAETPLHRATLHNQCRAAIMLIERGTNVSATDIHGATPLHHAARNNQCEVAVMLIERGAKVSATDIIGATPLHHAARKNQCEVAVMLIERGADISETDNHGATPLHHAAMHNRYEIATMLVERGADVLATDERGVTPLDSATWNSQSEVAFILGGGLSEGQQSGHRSGHGLLAWLSVAGDEGESLS